MIKDTKNSNMIGERAYRRHVSLEFNATRVSLPENLVITGEYDLADGFSYLIQI